MEAITVRQYEFHGLSIRSKVQLLKGYPKKRTAFQKYLFFQNFTYLGLTVSIRVWYLKLLVRK